MNCYDHYRKLLFFCFNRRKGENYPLMREYFAQIFIHEVEEFMPIWNRRVLDVGGAQGQFCRKLSIERRCDAINLDPDPGRAIWPKPKNIRSHIWGKTAIGIAKAMPFHDNEFDLGICRGVLEHIPREDQQPSVNELFRVTKRGGLVYILIPPWYNPHAGHRLKPFHMLPLESAKRLRSLFFKKKIRATSLAEMNLYPITFSRMRRLVLESGFEILATRDTHLRLHFMTRIPVLREIGVPAVAFILRK